MTTLQVIERIYIDEYCEQAINNDNYRDSEITIDEYLQQIIQHDEHSQQSVKIEDSQSE